MFIALEQITTNLESGNDAHRSPDRCCIGQKSRQPPPGLTRLKSRWGWAGFSPGDLSDPGIKLCLFPWQAGLSKICSVAQSCRTLCDPMNRSTPGLPVHTQIHVHRVGDAIQPSHPLSSPSPPAPNPSQHQSLFQ